MIGALAAYADEIRPLVETFERLRQEASDFQATERDCYAKIVKLVGGDPPKVDDGSGKKGMYGYRTEGLDHVHGRLRAPTPPPAPRRRPRADAEGPLPALNLFLQFLKRDEEQFNAALVEALQLHREYWTADEDRRLTTDGAVALGPLAIACLAHDVGMHVDVDSEYLPEHLLRRSWLGEFET